MSFISPLCALDLGSVTTRYSLGDHSPVLSKPTPPGIMLKGRVRDDELGAHYLRQLFFAKDHRFFNIAKPRVGVAVPGLLNAVELGGYLHAVTSSGALSLQLVSMALCAASGAGVDLNSSRSIALLACGAQYSELTILVSGSQVFSSELTCTTEVLTTVLIQAVKRELGVIVNPESMLQLITTHLSFDAGPKKEVRVAGKSLENGKVSQISIPWKLLSSELLSFAEDQVLQIQRQLNFLDAAFAADILEQGILLYGGFAKLSGFSLFLASRLKIPVSVVLAPEECVIKGLREIMTSISFTEYDERSEECKVLGC